MPTASAAFKMARCIFCAHKRQLNSQGGGMLPAADKPYVKWTCQKCAEVYANRKAPNANAIVE